MLLLLATSIQTLLEIILIIDALITSELAAIIMLEGYVVILTANCILH